MCLARLAQSPRCCIRPSHVPTVGPMSLKNSQPNPSPQCGFLWILPAAAQLQLALSPRSAHTAGFFPARLSALSQIQAFILPAISCNIYASIWTLRAFSMGADPARLSWVAPLMSVLSSATLRFEAALVGTAQPYWKWALLKYAFFFFFPLKKIETVAGGGNRVSLEA